MNNHSIRQSFRFEPLSFSWVAIHPDPKGVVQFIGGAFFGTFPTLFYRALLQALYQSGYTVVALPFRFTFQHWSVAISLLREQEALRQMIAERARKLGYKDDIYSKNECYQWVGHSLGCKYIALLEILADWSWKKNLVADQIAWKTQKSDAQIQQIERSLSDVSISIRDQPSLLIAPVIAGTRDAIQVPFLPELLDQIGLGVLPTPRETFDLIIDSDLFNLAQMISFESDKIAGSIHNRTDVKHTVSILLKILGPKLEFTEIGGTHLRPLGIKLFGYVVGPIAAPPLKLVSLALSYLARWGGRN